MNIEFKTIYPYILHILVIVIVNVFYFFPQFEGKVVNQGDIIQYKAMSKEAFDYQEKTGEVALWTNSMFGGMPTYQISAPNAGNKLSYIRKVGSMFMNYPAGLYILGMISFYIFMLSLGINGWLSLVGAILFGFSTNNFILFEAGHNTKTAAILTSPLVIAGVILLFKQRFLLGSALFGIGLGLNLQSNHPQMTYYLGLSLGILVVIEFINKIKERDVLNFAKSIGVLLIVAILALGSSASKLWTTYEYGKDTMRGAPILKSTGDTPASSSETDGLEWTYATQWSNGYGDLLATFIPKAVGGGSGEWLDGNSDLGKAVGQRREFQAPTYWGSLPFTSGPAYFGIVAFFLFVFGLFAVKGPVKWWLLGAVLLTFVMSLGKNMEGFNKLLFDTLPLLNKFRAPSSILSVTAIFIPILGILGISEILKSTNKETFLKPLYISAGILGGLCAMLWIGGSSMFDFSSQGDANYQEIIDELLKQRQSMLASSAFRSFAYIVLVSAVIWAFLKDKINSTILIAVIGVLGLFDLVQIGKDYLDKKDFVTKNTYKQNFEARPVDTQILQDNDPNFRVYDATINTFNSASTSYFHKTIGGYHAAKLQRYQDIIDRHISKNNQGVLNMLNTKYFILQGADGSPTVQRNPAALGNAWFVNNIIQVPDANAEIDSLTSFDPAGDAVVHNEFKDYIANLTPSKNGAITLKSYHPNKLVYESNTEGEQFAVFSEVWYGPNKGWQASIDGKPVDHIRTNYLLRGLKIPSGKHEVIFEFKPQAYFLGETISLISSLILIGLLIFYIYTQVRPSKDSVVKA